MKPEICFLPDKTIAFVSEVDSLEGIGRAWDTLGEFINSSKHLLIENVEYLGVCHDMPKSDDVSRNDMRYDAVVTVVSET